MRELPLPLLPHCRFFCFPGSAPLGNRGELRIAVLFLNGLIGISGLLFISSLVAHQHKGREKHFKRQVFSSELFILETK